MSTLLVAVIQLNATEDFDANIAQAMSLCKEALNKGAELIAMPEMFNYRPITLPPKRRSEPIPGPSLAPFMALAKEYGAYILAGSIGEAIEHSDKMYNTSVVIAPSGDIQAKYRKMNMFDATVGNVEIKESKAYVPGTKHVTTDIKGFKLGLSICFDIRFPQLYNAYKQDGADIIAIPSSFTSITGKMHWDVLCRARAIETQSYVLAPNQVGSGTRNVETYGNSLIIDPWGQVLARGHSSEEDIVYATLEKAYLTSVREKIPT